MTVDSIRSPSPRRIAKLLTTQELADASHATLRQLDHWTRSGYLVPVHKATGSGSRRAWSSEDVERARAMSVVGRLDRGDLLEVMGHSDPPWVVEMDDVSVTIIDHRWR